MLHFAGKPQQADAFPGQIRGIPSAAVSSSLDATNAIRSGWPCCLVALGVKCCLGRVPHDGELFALTLRPHLDSLIAPLVQVRLAAKKAKSADRQMTLGDDGKIRSLYASFIMSVVASPCPTTTNCDSLPHAANLKRRLALASVIAKERSNL